MKKIWLMQIGEPLPLNNSNRKMRTALLAEELASRGYKVLWWASAFDHQQKKWIAKDFQVVRWKKQIEIALLKGTGYKKNLSLARLWDHRKVAQDFKRRAKDFSKPDFIIASFPSYDLAYEAIQFAQKNQIPSIVDIRDAWPDTFVDCFPRPLKYLARLGLTHDHRIAKQALKNTDAITSMMDSLLNWGLKKANRARNQWDRVFYLGGTKTNVAPSEKKISHVVDVTKNKFVVTFIGTFGHHNNPMIIANAAKKLKSNPRIHFIFGGDGVYFHQVKKNVENLDNVSLLGWLTQQEISALLKLTTVGIVPATTHEKAFPNKAFVYLANGVPIISSSKGELWDFIENDKIGWNFEPGDLDTLTSCIEKLADTEEECRIRAKRARDMFEKKFDSKKIYCDFADMIEQILSMRSENASSNPID